MHYHVYDDNDTLHSVMLGTWFLPEYFDTISDAQVREPLKQIAHETHEDLEAFSTTLREHGVTVVRPSVPTSEYKTVLPALNVRDTMRVVDDTLYKLNTRTPDYDQAIEDVLDNYIDISSHISTANQYAKNLPMYSAKHYQELAGSDWPSFEDFCNGVVTSHTHINEEIEQYRESLSYDNLSAPEGPNILLHNNQVIVDHHEYVDFVKVLQPLVKTQKTWRSINTQAGHTDGCFNTLNSNTVIGIGELIDEFFPDYKKISVSWDNYQNHINMFNKHKQHVGGRWWVPGQEHNTAFTEFVEQYLGHLVGYVEETQFDVNVLSLDKNTVFVTSNDYHELKKHNITAIPVRWRHRWFHDGGLHCITLDLHRQ